MCLHKNQDKFKEVERQSLANKYIPIALNSLYSMLVSKDNKLDGESDDSDEFEEDNKGKLHEMKIKMKY